MEYHKEIDNEYHTYMSDLFQFCNQFFGSKYSVEEWLDLVDKDWMVNWVKRLQKKIKEPKSVSDFVKWSRNVFNTSITH